MGKRQLCAIGLAFWMAACGGSSARDDGGGGDLASDVPDGTADIGPTCRTEADCKALDAGPCGRVTCSAAGVCEVLADAGREGAACNPEDRCAVGGSTCRSGTCVPANRKSCIDRPCLSGRCDAASGECRYESLADGQSCDADAATFHRLAAKIGLGCRRRTTTSSPCPSPPEEERATACGSNSHYGHVTPRRVRAPGLHPPQNRPLVGQVPSPGAPISSIMRIAGRVGFPANSRACSY